VLLLTFLNGCSKKRTSGASVDLPQKVTIGTQVSILPDAIAIAEGWLTEAMGVEVDIVNFDAGRDVNTAMASGSIDFGQLGTPPAALAIASGIPCQVVYIQSVSGSIEALIVRNNLGINDAQGLVGLKIAVVFSSTSHYGLIKYLEVNNVNPSDVDIIDMRTGDILAAFLRGDIDGAFTWEPNVSRMKNNGGVMLTHAGEGANRGYPTMDLSYVRTEFAEKYPALVSAYIRTMERAVALYRSDPQAVAAILARYLGLTEEECLEQLTGVTWLSVSEQRGLRWSGGSSSVINSIYDVAMFLYEQGAISQEPSVELFQRGVTGRFLDLAQGN